MLPARPRSARPTGGPPPPVAHPYAALPADPYSAPIHPDPYSVVRPQGQSGGRVPGVAGDDRRELGSDAIGVPCCVTFGGGSGGVAVGREGGADGRAARNFREAASEGSPRSEWAVLQARTHPACILPCSPLLQMGILYTFCGLSVQQRGRLQAHVTARLM